MNLNENIHRIKQMMGIINENDELTNRILDKINTYGIDSLSSVEKKFLDNKSQDIEDDEVSDIASIDSGYEFNGTVDVYDDYLDDKRVAEVKFIYDETEEWDEDPVEYKHTGELYIDDEEYYEQCIPMRTTTLNHLIYTMVMIMWSLMMNLKRVS